jgi:hypothetical protein
MKPSFDEVRVLGQGLGYSQNSLRRAFILRLGRVITERDSIVKAKSMRPGARQSSLGGLSQFGAWRGTGGARAWSRLGRRSLLGTWSLCQAGGTFSSTRTWGSCAWEVVFEAPGLRSSSALGILPTVWGSFIGESGLISCGVLHNV